MENFAYYSKIMKKCKYFGQIKRFQHKVELQIVKTMINMKNKKSLRPYENFDRVLRM